MSCGTMQFLKTLETEGEKKRQPKINSFLALHFRTLQASKKGNFVWNNFLDEKAIMPPES